MPGLIRGVARTAVVAGTASAVSGRVARRQQGRWAAQEQQQAQAQQAQPQQPQPQQAPGQQWGAQPTGFGPGQGSDMDTRLAQLKDLGSLKEQGVLTEAEFQQQKDKILHA